MIDLLILLLLTAIAACIGALMGLSIKRQIEAEAVRAQQEHVRKIRDR